MSSKISADWCVLWVVTIELVFGRLVEVEPVATTATAEEEISKEMKPFMGLCRRLTEEK
jgi:hypothetical protein